MTYDTINDAQTIAGSGEGTLLANRYHVVRQLGQGGMGSVWLAEDTQLDNKPFAIKMLPSILVANKRAYRQLKDEALVAMKLTHPNIVTLRAFEENNGNPFLVMDYIDGQTLDDYLAEYSSRVEHVERVEKSEAGRDACPARPLGGLPEADVLRILRPIAAALDYAHSKGVVHRDVKPGNVMIAKDGMPYILDFGIAREIQETLTRVTGKLSSGTLLYMSPEQLHGATPQKEQDIYSFAAMAYECLKGEPPFARGQIEYQIDNDMPEPLLLSTGETPVVPVNGRDARSPNGALAAGVMAGLAKKPEGRPRSCVAVLEGRTAPQGGGTQVGELQPDAAGKVGATRPPRGCAWKALLAVAVLGLVAAGGGMWHHHREQVRIAADEKRRRADEEARKKAEEDAKLKARQKAATEIYSMASKIKVRVDGISDSDGFRKPKEEATEKFAESYAFLDEKVKRWAEAAQGFSNYVTSAKELIKRDNARQGAVVTRDRANAESQAAIAAEATNYAVNSWNAAVATWECATNEFGRADFPLASNTFAKAAAQFKKCAEEAKKERERQEAEAKAKTQVRQRAEKRREAALNARKDAETAEAEKHAGNKWEAAKATFDKAIAEFGGEKYVDAEKTFAEALTAFTDCATAAREKKRELDAQHAKEEQQKKEQEQATEHRKAEERRKAEAARQAEAERVRLADQARKAEEDLQRRVKAVIQAMPANNDLVLPDDVRFKAKWQNFEAEISGWGLRHNIGNAYALIDTTVFGACDEGILIDSLGITARHAFSDANGFISWNDFAQKGVVESSWFDTIHITLCKNPKIEINLAGSNFTQANAKRLFSELLSVVRSRMPAETQAVDESTERTHEIDKIDKVRNVRVNAMDNSLFYDHGKFNSKKAYDAYEFMCTKWGYPFAQIVNAANQRGVPFTYWSVDYAKGMFATCGMGGIIKENDIDNEISETEYFLLPGQSQAEYKMMPTHIRIKHDKTGEWVEKDLPAKKARWRVEHGWVYAFSSAGVANLDAYPEIKASISPVFLSALRSFHVERWNADGKIHEVEGVSNWNFLMGGDEGAIVTEYANYHDGNGLRFSVPGIGF